MKNLTNFLTKLKNNYLITHNIFIHTLQFKKLIPILHILKAVGYIHWFCKTKIKTKHKILICLAYLPSKKPIAQNIKQLSFPSHRVYYSNRLLQKHFKHFYKPVSQGLMCIIIQTPQGLMQLNKALDLHQGGEPILFIA